MLVFLLLTFFFNGLHFLSFLYLKKIILFIFDCSGSSLLCRLSSSCSKQWLLSRCGARASRCCGLQGSGSRAWDSAVTARGLSSCSSCTLEHRLKCCGTRAQLLLCMWDLPGSEIEFMSPTLEGRFFTTEPPEKASIVVDQK